MPISHNVQSCRRGSRTRAVIVVVSVANEAGNCLLTNVRATLLLLRIGATPAENQLLLLLRGILETRIRINEGVRYLVRDDRSLVKARNQAAPT